MSSYTSKDICQHRRAPTKRTSSVGYASRGMPGDESRGSVVVARQGLVEIPVPLDGEYSNPFDPGEVRVDAHVELPSGGRIVAPCFFTRPHELEVDASGRERWIPSGPAGWALRLSPREAGRHSIELRVSDSRGERGLGRMGIDVPRPSTPGLVEVRHDRTLERADGTPFVPIGMNLAWWVSPDPTLQIERALGRMAASGMNWARLWLTHVGDGLTIEWGRYHRSGHFDGLGTYSLAAAARLDRIFAEAARLGIGVQLVLWQHSQLECLSHSAWPENPYRDVNGGPCHSSREFFTSPEAVLLSDRRLRYLAARYGAYESLFAWEIFNEMDLVTDAELDLVAPWCADRARTLRHLDVHGHPITTSLSWPASLVPPTAFAADEYDLGQCHVYAQDVVAALAREAAAHAAHGKPTIVGEMGLGLAGEEDLLDREGLHLHDATWAALMLGFCGGAMSWWWDSYVDAQDHYGRQLGAARFCAGERLSNYGAPRTDLSAEGLRVLGRVGDRRAMAWLRAPDDRKAPGAVLVIPGLAAGQWIAEQWDTRSGEAIATFAVPGGGTSAIALRPFRRDTAVKMRLGGCAE